MRSGETIDGMALLDQTMVVVTSVVTNPIVVGTVYCADPALVLLAGPPIQPGLGTAYYQLAELHRLLGHFTDAEQTYGLASRHGVDPHPGLAQLRLAQGQAEAADAAIRRLKDETRGRLERCRGPAGKPAHHNRSFH